MSLLAPHKQEKTNTNCLKNTVVSTCIKEESVILPNNRKANSLKLETWLKIDFVLKIWTRNSSFKTQNTAEVVNP